MNAETKLPPDQARLLRAEDRTARVRGSTPTSLETNRAALLAFSFLIADLWALFYVILSAGGIR